MSDTRGPELDAADQILPETPAPGSEEAPAAPERPRARLLPMWILIAAVVIVGVAWAMSERYFGDTEVAESVPLVTAEQTPVKVRPEEPGGVDVPDRDKYVYKSLTDEEPEAEQLLPPPEEPMERPPIEVEQVAAPEVIAQAEDTAMEAPAPPPLDELVVAEVETPMAEAEFMKQGAEAEGEPSVEAAVDTAAVLEEAPIAPEAEETPAPAPEPEITSAAPEPSAALRADSGRFLVQIGAAQDEAAANGEIARLAKKHPDILSTLSGMVIRADLGDKGVWYRMRVGPFATRGDANGVCGQLKAVNVGCFVVAN